MDRSEPISADGRVPLDTDVETLGRELYDRLLRGLAPDLHTRHVVIVPHGRLFHVPFLALADGPGGFVVRRHAVTVLPSVAVGRLLVAARAEA